MSAPQNSTQDSPPFPWIGMLVLAGAAFVAVTTEFLPTGLIRDISRSLEVSESQVGLLVTIFAGTVVLSTAPLTALTRNHPRKGLVLVVLVVFAIGNGIAALAPSYGVLVVARVIGGLAHGLFWAVVGAYAAHLVPKHQIAKAVAITSAGTTTAFVLGVPVGTLLGHALGWRMAFAVAGIVVLILAALVAKFLPGVSHIEELATGEIALPLRRDKTIRGVILVCLIVVIMMMGHNTFYTYIAPYVIDISGFAENQVAMLLFIYGGAGVFGLALAGYVGSRFPRSGLIVMTAIIAAIVFTFASFSAVPWVVVTSLVLWGIVFGGAPVLLQVRLLHTASPRIRDTASAYFTTAFNIAIGGGALLGAILLDNYGLHVLPYANIAFLIAALALMLITEIASSRRRARLVG